jgi:acyl transferase domain-containing protein
MTTLSEKIGALAPAHRELFERLRALQESRTAPAIEPIAVVGIGCRLPGNVHDSASFWDLLAGARDAVTEVPASRWNREAWYHAAADTPGRMVTRHGAFLDGIDRFDAEFFGIAPREAVYLDPQHRLLLEVTWEALENAGCAPDTLQGSSTGVFVGLCTQDYYRRAFADVPRIGPYCATGTFAGAGAGRISYALGLEGPSLAVDTACSSSLVAVHLACQSLRLKECTVALAGGVNLVIDPELGVSLTKANMLSADGRCKTFDADADGFGRGEGCGIVVLKPLADAERDGDFIWAVIAGSAVNQDGRSNGLTAPNGRAQETLLRTALRAGGISPHDVGYIEAHGTGTALGDPVEAGALAAVFGEQRPGELPLVVGSVKSNIGHLEVAAGIAGLIKAVLCVHHRQIVPNLHFRKLNPHIEEATKGCPIEVPTRLAPWPVVGRAVAGVSSFGFGGTNAHVVLAAPPERSTRQSEPGDSAHLLCLSAKSTGALRELAGRFSDLLLRTDMALADICFTANSGRAHFDHRLAVIGRSCREMGEKLAPLASVARSRHNGDAPAIALGEASIAGQRQGSAGDGNAAAEARLHELAASYVRGDRIDWACLYAHRRLSRVPLPTYPFQRERYWLESPSKPIAAEPAAASPSNGHHPGATSSQKTNGFAARSSAVAPVALNGNGGNGQGAIHAGREHLHTVLEESIVRVLELPTKNSISPDQDLYDLGMDSITALEMLFAAEKLLGFALRQPGIARSRTINQFIECIRSGVPSHVAPADSVRG